MIRIRLNSVMVDDQAKAREFYTNILGFRIRHDIDMGGAFWLTVTAADDPDGTELLLEPNSGLAEAPVFQKALYDSHIPATALAADDLDSEYERLRALGVAFRAPPARLPDGTAIAAFDDTCGNWIQLYQVAGEP